MTAPATADGQRDSLGVVSQAMLDLLPVAAYVCDSGGAIVRYNARAAALWGRAPVPGDPAVRYCGSLQMFDTDGTPLADAAAPMARVLATGAAIAERSVVVERADGTLAAVKIGIEPIRDDAGAVIGAINCFHPLPPEERIEIGAFRRSEDVRQLLEAIVQSSDDAIVSKDLAGTITSWNASAERLFGYDAAEAVGRLVTMLIPDDRLDEERMILDRIGRGERVPTFETLRRRKDGTLVDVSLTISPVHDAGGRVVGASKIARDITERKRTQARQDLLLREINHRVKNLFTLASAVVSLSGRSARTVDELVADMRERLGALSRAHALTLPDFGTGAERAARATGLRELLRTIVSPYDVEQTDASHVALDGPDVPIGSNALSSMALLLHELATNSAKYGALSQATGRVEIRWSIADDALRLAWRETGGPPIAGPPASEGFGSLLAHGTLRSQFSGDIERDWNAEGLTVRLYAALDRLGR
ncbi:MAG: PAS domain S-box protein [Rhodospirillales bacterium]